MRGLRQPMPSPLPRADSLDPVAAATPEQEARPFQAPGRIRVWGQRLGSAIDSADRTRALALLIGASVVVWILQSIAWPVIAGRDLGTYLRYYAQMWDLHAVLPQAMVGRTPVTPLVAGLTLEVGGFAVELLMAVLFVASVVAWTLTAAAFGRRPAVVVAALLLLYPGYGALFHQFSSDALSAAGFAFWSLAAVRISLRPRAAAFALLGVGLVLLVLIRPSNQVLLAFGLLPLFLDGAWPERIGRSAAFLATAVALLFLWSAHNAWRYDDFTVARGAGIIIPFFRAFEEEKIVSPDNGPASRKLAEAVEQHLLTEEPYRSYGIDLDTFFTSGSGRMTEDAGSLSDRVFGWDTDYKTLQEAGIEAVKKHPGTYAKGVARTMWSFLRSPAYVTVSSSSGSASEAPAVEPETIVVNGRELPKPSEGQPIPGSHQGLWSSTPDNRIREVWTSPTEHHLVFERPGDAARVDDVNATVERLSKRLPDRSGNATLAHRLNQASYRFPPPGLWLLIGLVAVAFRRPIGTRVTLALAIVSVLMLFVTALGVPAVGEYAMPVSPTVALLLGVGLP